MNYGPRKCHRIGLSVAALAAVLLFAGWMNPYRERVEEGNRQFAAGEYEKALGIYADAAAVFDPESRELHFNIGDSWYKQGDYQKAIEEYSRVFGSNDVLLEAKAHYNIGNASFEQEDYAGAIEAYVRSLKLNNKDEDAKYNLEVARKKLKEQLDKMKNQQRSQDQQQAQSPQQEQKQEQGQENQEQQQEQRQQAQGEEERDKEKKQPEQSESKEEVQNENPNQPQKEVELSREDAERLLDRLQEDEEQQRREMLRRPSGGSYTVEKDW